MLIKMKYNQLVLEKKIGFLFKFFFIFLLNLNYLRGKAKYLVKRLGKKNFKQIL